MKRAEPRFKPLNPGTSVAAIAQLSVVAMLCFAILLVFLAVLDWRRFAAIHHTKMAATDFLSALGAFHYNFFRIRFVQLVTSRELLDPTEGTLRVVKGLSLSLDGELSRVDFTKTGVPEVDAWRMVTDRKGKKMKRDLSSWGPRLLDELLALELSLSEAASLRPGG